MKDLSARNQLRGTVTNVVIDGVTAEVTIDVGNDQQITSVITRNSVERLGLKTGSPAIAIIKATDVLVGIADTADGGDA